MVLRGSPSILTKITLRLLGRDCDSSLQGDKIHDNGHHHRHNCRLSDRCILHCRHHVLQDEQSRYLLSSLFFAQIIDPGIVGKIGELCIPILGDPNSSLPMITTYIFGFFIKSFSLNLWHVNVH